MSSSDEDCSEENNARSSLLTAADRLLEVAEHGTVSTSGLLDPRGSDLPKFRSIEERLLQLHIEESAKAVNSVNVGPHLTNGLSTSSTTSSSGQHHLNPCSNLVSLLCRKDRCNRLLVTLLPSNEGYSVHVLTTASVLGNPGPANGNSISEIELFRLPYEDDDFLSYVDNEELPTPILDLLEKAWPELFYSGCVIAEVRDHRRLPPQNEMGVGPPEDMAGLTSHVLLRPTTQSIICDVNLLCERSGWTTREERAVVESQVCLATEGPLCLDPDPIVSILARKSCVRRQKFATPAMRRHAKMFSQTGFNRKRKLEETAGPPELKLHNFLQKLNRNQTRPAPQEMLQQHQAMMRANLRAIVQSQQLPVASSTASGIAPPDHLQQIITDVPQHARAIQRRADVTDMTPHVVEEYILETAERGANRIYHTKLTIFQRLANEEYLGELYVERDFNERDKKGSTCRFVLGTRPHALRYINQFTEIFTEEGRKPVKITHLVPNQKPRITFTPGMRERMNERAAAVAAANAARASLAGGAGGVSPTVSAVSTVSASPQTVAVTAVAPGNLVNNGTLQKPLIAVSVGGGGPSILKQTLSAPTNAAQQQPIPIHTVQPQPVTAVVRTSTVLQQQPQPTTLQLPQTPHPPQQVLQQHQPPATPQQDSEDGGEQEMAISAIMQSLMKDSAQFEVENSNKQQQQLPQQPTIIGVSGPQLPTCPVPQASLTNVALSNNSPVKLPNTPQSPSSSSLHAKRVSLKNLLSAQANQQQQQSSPSSDIKPPQVKVTLSQLAAQLSRPVTITSNLPSYSQALADQAQVKAAQASPRPRLIVTAQHHPNTLVRSISDSGKVVTDAPNLQALLSGGGGSSSNPENVIPVELGNNGCNTNSSGSLLERLVSGQPLMNSNLSPNNASSPVTSRAMSNNASGSAGSGDSEQITLAALLSKPVQNMSPLAVAASPSSSSQMGSPTKASPLIQQLQQPIPPPRTPLSVLPQSPRQQPQASPRMTSPRPQAVASSPQQLQQPTTVVRSNSGNLQQQLMQPPKSQSLVSVPLPVQDINSLQHNGIVNSTSNISTNGGNMVSLQNLLQGGMTVQVSQHPATQTSSSIPVQLNIPGLSAPVTLSLNVQDQQQQPNQIQQQQGHKFVPTSTVVTVTAASNNTAGGTVLIPQGSNIIQLPQQPASVISSSIATMRTTSGQTVQLHAANANNILKGAQVVQVRGQHGGQPLYVQMPAAGGGAGNGNGAGNGSSGAQSIQIVRSVDQPMMRQQQFTNAISQAPQPGQQQLILNSVKTSQPSLITLSQQQQLPQQQMVLQANSAILQPQSGQQSRQVAIQLQEQPQAAGSNLLAQTRVVNNQAAVAAVANQRMRQQRKQSLK